MLPSAGSSGVGEFADLVQHRRALCLATRVEPGMGRIVQRVERLGCTHELEVLRPLDECRHEIGTYKRRDDERALQSRWDERHQRLAVWPLPAQPETVLCFVRNIEREPTNKAW